VFFTRILTALHNEILTLNVAGPRESKEPGVAEFVREVLEKAFSR
jgi:hypothetical protein